MITKVKLKNWRSHLDSEFKFSSGVNTLLGIMGSGKSAVLDGICFALFGTFPMLNQRKVKLDEVIRNKPNRAKTASVEVEFKRDEETYRVKREIELGKGTQNVEFRKNGELVEAGSSRAVTNYVCKVLETNYDVFSRAIYSEQNNIDEFLRMPKGKRMEKIDSLLQIDKFEDARKNVTTVINKFKQELKSKRELSKEILTEEDEGAIKDLKEETKKLSEDMESLKEKLESLQEEKEKLSEEIEKLEEAEEAVKKLQSKKDNIKGKISQMKESLEEIGEVELKKEKIEEKLKEKKSELEEFKEKEDEVKKLKEELASVKSKIDLLKENIESVKNQIKKKGFGKPPEELENLTLGGVIEALKGEKEEENLKLEIESLTSEITKKERRLEALLTEKEYAKQVITELETGNLCPTCKTELSGEKQQNIIQEKEEKKDKIKKRRQILENEVKDARKELKTKKKKLEEKKEEETELKSKANLILDKLNSYYKHKKDKKKAEEELEKLEEKIKEKEPETNGEKLKEKIESLENSLKFYEFKEKISSLKEELSSIDEKIEKKEKIIEDLEEKEEKYNKLTAEEKGVKSSLDGLKDLHSEKKERLEGLLKKKEQLKKVKKEIEEIKERKEQLKLFKTALKSTQESLREEFVENANRVMSEIWDSLYPYDDLESIKLIIEERDYVLKVRTANGWTEVEGVASGGERTLASLALRIAFSFALAPNLSWLVLDEPTHNLDSNSMEELAVVLRERLPDIIDQIFLITHEQRLESAVSGYLYKLERDKEKDEPTKVELVSEPEG